MIALHCFPAPCHLPPSLASSPLALEKRKLPCRDRCQHVGGHSTESCVQSFINSEIICAGSSRFPIRGKKSSPSRLPKLAAILLNLHAKTRCHNRASRPLFTACWEIGVGNPPEMGYGSPAGRGGSCRAGSTRRTPHGWTRSCNNWRP